MENDKDLKKRKDAVIGGNGTTQSSKDVKKSGYQIFHLILVALVSLLIGAFITKSQQLNITSTVPNVTPSEENTAETLS